jgi:8-oxo-dGTP pyrophosphatase MutT (NUDIX family)
MNEDFFNVGVKALIRNSEGNILMFRVSNREMQIRVGWKGEVMWDIPGGRIKKGSTAIKTLESEVKEETGLKINCSKLFDCVFAGNRLKNEYYGDIGLILFIYEVTVEPGEVKLNFENDSYEWLPPIKAAEKLRTKYPMEFCEKVGNLS